MHLYSTFPAFYLAQGHKDKPPTVWSLDARFFACCSVGRFRHKVASSCDNDFYKEYINLLMGFIYFIFTAAIKIRIDCFVSYQGGNHNNTLWVKTPHFFQMINVKIKPIDFKLQCGFQKIKVKKCVRVKLQEQPFPLLLLNKSINCRTIEVSAGLLLAPQTLLGDEATAQSQTQSVT